jgi:hypothetical protein
MRPLPAAALSRALPFTPSSAARAMFQEASP